MRRATHERILADRERAFAREREGWLRERQDLLDRIMYMADRPWNTPPVDQHLVGPEPDETWDDIVRPEELTSDELGELAHQNGTE